MVRQAHHERIIFPLSLSLSKAVRTMSGNKAALREILRSDVASGLSMTSGRYTMENGCVCLSVKLHVGLALLGEYCGNGFGEIL